jgi:hypothetical protein
MTDYLKQRLNKRKETKRQIQNIQQRYQEIMRNIMDQKHSRTYKQPLTHYRLSNIPQ